MPIGLALDSSANPLSSSFTTSLHIEQIPPTHQPCLLHAHEMSTHALLAINNIEVMEAFFEGIREGLVGVVFYFPVMRNVGVLVGVTDVDESPDPEAWT